MRVKNLNAADFLYALTSKCLGKLYFQEASKLVHQVLSQASPPPFEIKSWRFWGMGRQVFFKPQVWFGIPPIL